MDQTEVLANKALSSILLDLAKRAREEKLLFCISIFFEIDQQVLSSN